MLLDSGAESNLWDSLVINILFLQFADKKVKFKSSEVNFIHSSASFVATLLTTKGKLLKTTFRPNSCLGLQSPDHEIYEKNYPTGSLKMWRKIYAKLCHFGPLNCF